MGAGPDPVLSDHDGAQVTRHRRGLRPPPGGPALRGVAWTRYAVADYLHSIGNRHRQGGRGLVRGMVVDLVPPAGRFRLAERVPPILSTQPPPFATRPVGQAL